MPPTPHSVPCLFPVPSPLLLPVLKVPICLLHLTFLIKLLSERISWKTFWGHIWESCCSSPFLLPLPLCRPTLLLPRYYNIPAIGFTAFAAIWCLFRRVCSYQITFSPQNTQLLPITHRKVSSLPCPSFKILHNLDPVSFSNSISSFFLSVALTHSFFQFLLTHLAFYYLHAITLPQYFFPNPYFHSSQSCPCLSVRISLEQQRPKTSA